MVKNKICFLLIAFSCSMSVWAQRVSTEKPSYHFVYVSGAGTYNNFRFNSTPAKMTPQGGVGGLFGLGYEFRMQGGWASLGADIQMFSTISSTQTQQSYYPVAVFGNRATYKYYVQQKDLQNWFYLNVPVMAGYYYKGVYVGAGVKVGIPIGQRTHVSGSYYTTCIYDFLPDVEFDYESSDHSSDLLPKTAIDQNATTKLNLNPQFSLLFELGYDILALVRMKTSSCQVLKIGVYGELGFNDAFTLKPLDAKETIVLRNPNVDLRDVESFTPYYNSKTALDVTAKPYSVGLKVTYMFGKSSVRQTNTVRKGCACYYMK